MEKIPIENWNNARIHTAQAMIRSMEAEMRLLEKQRDVMSVCKSEKVRSLEMQVQQLEKQRDFLSLWKPDLHNGLHMQDTHVDVQLQASDGSCIYAHKAVLAARSTEFEAMFRNVESKIIEVAEMSLEELNAFVSFFYKATIDANVLLKHSPALLQAANKYKVDFLTSICEEALVTNISKENVISKFFVAKKHCSEAVMEAVLKEATTLGDVSTFTEYKKYSQTDAGLLLEFYEKLARLKKAKGSKRRRVGKAAEPGTGSPTLNNSTSFVGSNGKAEKEDDKEEDYHKGEEKEGEMGKRKVKEEGSFGRMTMPFEAMMMPALPFGVSPFMPPFMPPYVAPMYHGGPMPGGFSGGGGPGFTASTEVRANQGKCGPDKKVPGTQPKKSQLQQRKPQEDIEEQPLPQGVVLTKKKLYKASIMVNGKNHNLGIRKTQEEAAHLYDRAAYVCGRETNAELPQGEKQELEGLLWEEFLDFPKELQLKEKRLQKVTLDAAPPSSLLPQSWLEEDH
ncbi:unnamed protein product [Sphagnum jensenii]|uniref:BTB domain-containing protein n=1 Tax=Sphagnum jensenii TaxID=128206 RepID=A0ABP1B145_9BRYO